MKRLITMGIVAVTLAVILPSAAPTAGQPNAPGGASGMALSNAVQLAWQQVSGGNTTYNVYRGTSMASVDTLVTPAGGVTGTTFTDTTAGNGNTYFYAVRAVQNGVESTNSMIVQSTPVPQACSSGNAIVLENCYPGNNPWTVRNAATIAAGGIEGYATATSINKGQSVNLKVNSANGSTFRAEIYRTGYYGGAGARLFSVIRGVAGRAQPACTTDSTTGLIDCSNWSTSLTLTTTSSWPTGTYQIRLVRDDTGADNAILLVVRDDSRKAQVVYGVGFATFEAYNNYGGKSLYDFNSNGNNTVAGTPRAVKVSYDRPFEQPRSGLRDWYTRTEFATVYWLEQQGYDVGYVSNTDIGTTPSLIQGVEAYISPAHDEYVSAQMRSAMTSARDAGTGLFFSGGNEIYWKIRFENGPNGGTNRVQTCYKSTQSGPADPSGIPTGTWRDPNGANAPENALTGIMYVGDNDNTYFPLVVSAVEGSDRIYRYTPLSGQPAGGSMRVGTSIVGWEWDARVANGQEPAGVKTLATSPVTGELIQNNGANYNPSGSIGVNMVKYTAASGALVFSTGTNNWNRGLALSAFGVGEPDGNIQQITTNVLADMGATPQTPSPGITLDAGLNPNRPASPANVNATTAGPDSISISWDPVAGADGYNVYRALAGRDNGQPLGALANPTLLTGTTFNDIGLSATTAYYYVVVAVKAGVQSLPSAEATATTAAGAGQPTRIDVGASTPYTSSTGQVWSADTFFSGGNLRSVTTPIANTNDPKLYQTERWGLFNYAIPVANGTYNVRFHFGETYWGSTPALSPCQGKRVFNLDILDTPGGTPDVSNFDICAAAGGPAIATVVTIPNVAITDGVLNIKSTDGLADDPTLSAIEVIPTAIAPPTVVVTAPGNAEADVAVGVFPRVTFSRSMDASTIDNTTFTLTGPSGPAVPASVSFDASTQTATLDPTSALAFSTTYTAKVAATVKASDGAPLATAYTWQFTTQAPPPPDVSSTSPADGDADVSPATNVRATFTQPINPASITTSSFTLRDSTGALVPATVGYNATLQQAILTPTSQLTLGGTYTARLGTTVSTQQSATLDAPFVWSFTVATVPPPPPSVTSFTPANGATAVGASVAPTATFSVDMDPSMLTPSTFTLSSAAGPVPATVTYDSPSRTATLTPNAPLAPTTVYTVQLTTAVRGEDGTPFAGKSWSFTTVAGPTVTSTAPVNGATYVGRSAAVTATFSRAMLASSITSSTFHLYDPSGAVVAATVSYDNTSNTATLTPSAQLLGGSTYAAVLSGSVQAADGTPVGSDDTWKYTTSVCPCSLFPGVLVPAVQNIPTRDGRPLPGPWSYEMGVKFTVDEAMRLNGIRFFKSSSETGTHVANLWTTSGLLLGSATATNETASGWQEATFASPPLLQAGSVYIASVNVNSFYNTTVGGLANQIISGPVRTVVGQPNGVYGSAAGVFPNSSFNSSNYFTDVDVVPDGDPAAPTVTATTPAVNATNVDANVPLTATFSRPMDPSTINATSFNVRPVGTNAGTDAGGAVDATVRYNDATNTAELDPSAPLAHGVQYSATLTTAIRAADGKPLATGLSWTFTVSAPPPPLAVTATPANGATNVGIDTAVKLAFNRAVDASTLTSSTVQIVAPDGTVVPASIGYDVFSLTGTITPSSKLAGNTTYTVKVTTGVLAPDGTSMLNPYSSTFTTGACPCTLMTGLVPKTVSNPVQDGRTGAGPWSYELGTKIVVDQQSTLTAIRYWKDARETGTHTVRVWSASGALMASQVVTGETAGGGWQQANLATPLVLSPNTVYIVSFNINAFFATTRSGLATPLTAGIAHTANDVKNGVYGSAAGVFPTNSFSSTNYFVDVVIR